MRSEGGRGTSSSAFKRYSGMFSRAAASITFRGTKYLPGVGDGVVGVGRSTNGGNRKNRSLILELLASGETALDKLVEKFLENEKLPANPSNGTGLVVVGAVVSTLGFGRTKSVLLEYCKIRSEVLKISTIK